MVKKNEVDNYTLDNHLMQLIEDTAANSRKNSENIIRIDERQKSFDDKLETISQNVVQINTKLDSLPRMFVTSDKHEALSKIVWWGMGILSAVLVGTVTAVVSIVLKQ